MLGQAETEVLGSFPWHLQLDYDFGDSAETNIKSYFQSETSTKKESLVSHLYLSVCVQSLSDTNQRMIILRDITTALKKADEAQLEAERAVAASKSKTEMMQMLSHEFRTPLQGITGVASTMMVDMAREDDNFDNISNILATSQLLLTLIGNVLDLGKIEADKMQEVELRNIPESNSIKETLLFCEPFASLNLTTEMVPSMIGRSKLIVCACNRFSSTLSVTESSIRNKERCLS
jgi:signal transduction histidine kinase